LYINNLTDFLKANEAQTVSFNQTNNINITNTNGGPKQFARKSTAPINALSNINQNIALNQQQKKLSNKISSHQNQHVSVATTTTSSASTTTTTPIQNSIRHQGLTQVINGSSSLHKLNSKSTNMTASLNHSNTYSNSTVSPHSQLTPIVKQFRNKIISCKPYCESKGTECAPVVKDASTQIDLDDIKLSHTIVPLPVPLHVPLPMCMYQAPMPLPLLIPLPIPVPIFIPTTKKTYDRIQRRVQVRCF
jgi:hypothetical protein